MRTEAVNRVRLVFTLFDADGNGAIDADDFTLMADRVDAAAGDADEAAKGALREAFRRYGEVLVAESDADHDGRVDFDEYSARVLSPEVFGPTIAAFADALSALGDPDGDGYVERQEFLALLLAIGFERENIEALFEALAEEGGDRVAVTRWAEEIRAYYAPDQGGIPADRLVGGPTGA